MDSIRQLIASAINLTPFVSRAKYRRSLEALERSNAENRKAIRTLFEVTQSHRRELLLAEKQRLEELAHVLEIYVGSPCELGGIKFRVRSSSSPLDD